MKRISARELPNGDAELVVEIEPWFWGKPYRRTFVGGCTVWYEVGPDGVLTSRPGTSWERRLSNFEAAWDHAGRPPGWPAEMGIVSP